MKAHQLWFNDNAGGEYEFEEYLNYTMFVRIQSKSLMDSSSTGERFE